MLYSNTDLLQLSIPGKIRLDNTTQWDQILFEVSFWIRELFKPLHQCIDNIGKLEICLFVMNFRALFVFTDYGLALSRGYVLQTYTHAILWFPPSCFMKQMTPGFKFATSHKNMSPSMPTWLSNAFFIRMNPWKFGE